VPEVEALLPRFRAAHTQVVVVSVDSVYSHANWARDLGGISFPLLSDFEPKGGLARSYGAYLDAPGITDRATILIDSGGIVRHASSVGPGGQRDIAKLAALCEEVDASSEGHTQDFAEPAGLPSGSVLFVKSRCGFSRTALLARDNLHLASSLAVRNVSDDAGAREELARLTGGEQAPCLVIEGSPQLESDAIVKTLVERSCP
jgi:glutaredoxin-related protein